ncbi:phage holin family protein [Thermoanaerobacterium sp. R66]|uniref:phage holin family protein n=1 Tax=Thermoanaerobacterium sp. R66 TaxID=2742479 RepID=UPI0023806FCA|nr:phage holin family protein [Thermoanaerobacterium sp. R66]MDE4542251.1 phage holin family protein [Thermoanaerobacterium sp. R66]
MKYENIFKTITAFGGALASYLFGGWSALLGILLVFVIFDYITGVIAAGMEGKLNSSIGWKGISRKVMIFVLVAMAHLVDTTLGDSNVFRDATIFFYLANELLSIIENTGRIGLPVPDAIQKAVAILKGKGEVKQ